MAALRSLIAAGFLLATCGDVLAVVTMTPGSATFRYPSPGRPLGNTWHIISGTGGTVSITEPMGSLPATMGGAAINGRRVATRAAVARAAARAIPFIGTALTIADLAEQLRCSAQGGGWSCDPGEDPEERPNFCTTGQDGQGTMRTWCATTPIAACSSRAGASTSTSSDQVSSSSVTYAASHMEGTTCIAMRTATYSGASGTSSSTVEIGWSVTDTGSAPACASGAAGLDGRCPSFPSVQTPVSVDDMSDRFEDYLPDNSLPGVAREVFEGGGEIPELGHEPEVSGPASATGAPKESTTTGPAGTTTTTTTNNYNYSYAGDTVTVNTTTTTTTHNPDGTTTTTTDGETPADQQDDLCALHPDIVACEKLGTAPAKDDLPNDVKTLAITPTGGWQSSGGCPAPRVVQTQLAGSLTFSFDYFCQAGDYARPMVIAVAWLLAIGAFFGFSSKRE